jgi:nucleoside-diphosphate-sugar epimerase
MPLFVTGATGHIGSAVVPDLLAARHTVVGLARSEASAARLAAAGAEAWRGSLDDLGGRAASIGWLASQRPPGHVSMAAIAQMDNPSSSTATRALLKWEPAHAGLLADLAGRHYFELSTSR